MPEIIYCEECGILLSDEELKHEERFCFRCSEILATEESEEDFNKFI